MSQETDVTDVAAVYREAFSELGEFLQQLSAMILFKSPLAEVLPSLYQALRNFIGVQCEDQVITPVAIDV